MRRWSLIGFAAALAAPTGIDRLGTTWAAERRAGPSPAAASPATQPASAASLNPGKHYFEVGLAQYRQGDWPHARENLQRAMDAGYLPTSIYQDSPAQIIKRMEARQEADRERVNRLSLLPAEPSSQPGDRTTGDPLAVLRATDEARALRRHQAVEQSAAWVKDAREELRVGHKPQALDLFTRAADLDPSNADAISGRSDLLAATGRSSASDGPSPNPLRDSTPIAYEVQHNLEDALEAIDEEHWATAETAIDRARVAAAADPTRFSAQELRRFHIAIDQTELDLKQARQRVEGNIETRTAEAVHQRVRQQRVSARQQRQATIADLTRTSQNQINRGKYKDALATIDQILILDPNNEYAVGIRSVLEDQAQFDQQRQYTELRNRNITDQLNAAEEMQIPYMDVLRYPTDWPDISQRRDQTLEAERNLHHDEASRAVENQLDRKLPEVRFDNVGFGDVVDFLRDVSGTNIFVKWKTLEGAGVDRSTPVTANLHNVKFSKALNTILQDGLGGQAKLAYTVDEGVITISTAEELAHNVSVRVYDIRDLIINIPDFTDAPQFSLDSAQNTGGGASGGGGGGVQMGNMLFNGGTAANMETGPTRQELVDSITKLIEDTVATDTWKDNGGAVGALRELQGQLVVTQTPENHRLLANLLEKLRESRAIQINIETRFITVTRNFMDDVGLDLNFLFNLNNSWSKNFGPIQVGTPSSNFTQSPATGVQGSIGNSSVTPSGLTTAATYLDDFQVQMLFRAVQASVNTTISDTPRLTLFNGQRAYVLVAVQRAYISNLTPVVSTGIASFAPTIGIVNSGVLLDVEAHVSADRKYVTLILRPQMATLLSLASFQFQTVDPTAAAANVGVGAVGRNGAITPVVPPPSGLIQEPELQITQVKTVASVPDGGTLLIGGETTAGETEREIGTPLASKIPFLKRLFTNRSAAKDEQILLILVKPTILMQKEIEQKSFPLLTTRLQGQ
jgi:type II secretory pathway component GspD/PulD (secretin)/tetratricopeptide (TPR) repeat protein